MTKAFVLALIAVLCLVGSEVHAAMTSAAVTGLKSTGGSYSLKSPSATAANGSFNMSANVTQSGRQIQMPASAQFAANAAQFAVSAIRLSPQGFLVGAVASWAIANGMQYAANQWTHSSTTGSGESGGWEGYLWCANTCAHTGKTSLEAATKHCTVSYPGHNCTTPSSSYVYGGAYEGKQVQYSWSPYGTTNTTRQSTCYSGYTLTNGICTGSVSSPATEADFTNWGNSTLPDAAASELVKVLDMPINAPVLNPSAVDTYGAPYLDPLSGRMVKELVRTTPDPTAADPLNVRVEKYQVDAGAVPGQTAAPEAATKEASAGNQIEPVKFPSDYARQGEAATAAQSINDALGPKLDKITETGTDPVDPAQVQGSEFDQAFFQGTFSGLLGWQLPAHTSQCPTSAFNWNGQSFTLDSHCQLVNNHFSALASVMSVVWTIVALFILLGA